MKGKKKIILIIVALFVLLFGLRGTIAYLTATDEIENEFTIGEINNPSTDPEGNPFTDPITGDPITLSGNLYEKYWDPAVTHKVIPGASFQKEPYVGVGAGSEEAVVYVYVKNDFPNNVYFTLASGWTAVSSGGTDYYTVGPTAGTYKSGLFKYNTNLAPTSNADAWTTKLFDYINVANNASVADLTPAGATSNITVKSLVHQAKNANGSDIETATIETAAINLLVS